MADEIDEAQAVVEYCLNIQIANIRQIHHVAAPSLFECEQCGNAPPNGDRPSQVFLYVWNARGQWKS